MRAAESAAVVVADDHDLIHIVKAWANLPKKMRRAILALIEDC